MIFNLHQKALDNFNKRAFELIEIVEERVELIYEKDPPRKGSSAEKPVIDLSDKMADRPVIWSTTSNDVRVEIFESYKGRLVGIGEKNYPTFLRLVETLYKSKPIIEKITESFIYDHLFKWLVKTFKANKQAESDFISYLLDQANDKSSDYKYSFKILNLSIDKRFKIGNVEFDYIDESFFHHMEKKQAKDVEAMKEMFMGEVFATIVLKDIHDDKGITIARKECYKAMNVLKLFCETVRKPNRPSHFDIDTRVGTSNEFEFLVQDLNNIEGLTITRSGSKYDSLSEENIDQIIACKLNFESLILNPDPNELQMLLLNALDKFAYAISQRDLNRRIVDLFTIWESLLLKNDSVNIQDSLIYYGCELLRPTGGIKEFGTFILSLYDTRSALVHHAKNKSIDLEVLTKFQVMTINLIETMIGISTIDNTKIQVLEKVDNHLGKTVEQYTEERKSAFKFG